MSEARPDAVGAMEKRRLLRQTDDESGRARLLEGGVVEGVSRFCFRSRGRISGPIRSVEAQDVAGLLSLGFNLMFLSALPCAVLAAVTPITDPPMNDSKETRI